MPKRILRLSQTEPARTILLWVSVATFIMQSLVLIPAVSPNFLLNLPNALLVCGICAWGAWTAVKNNVRQMPWASFVLFIIWLWGGLTRLLFTPEVSSLLWTPFFVVAGALSVIYIYLNGQKRMMPK